MPNVDKILGKPVNEEKWARAKKRAAEEGHAEDWAYVMSIYKKMAHLSDSDGKKKSKETVEKSSSVDTDGKHTYNDIKRFVLADGSALDEFRCGHCRALLFKGLHLEKSVIEVKCRSCGTLNINR